MTFPLRVFAIDREIFVGDANSLTVPIAGGTVEVTDKEVVALVNF